MAVQFNNSEIPGQAIKQAIDLSENMQDPTSAQSSWDQYIENMSSDRDISPDRVIYQDSRNPMDW